MSNNVKTRLAVGCLAVNCLWTVLLFGFVTAKDRLPDDRFSWKGRQVVFFGDSITDPVHVGCETNYWGFLAERMGFSAHVYGKDGWQMSGVGKQLLEARNDLGNNIDAIFIFMGTNDFNGNVPRGEWFLESVEYVNKDGEKTLLKKREPSYDMKTFRGRTNAALRDVKRAYPRAQVILLTPLHRGYAAFGERNVQPDERYGNRLDLFINDYVDDLKFAGALWSVPVIDLFGESGILPNEKEHGIYMAHPDGTDSLHPSTAGHERIARVIESRLSCMTPSFR